MTDDLGRKTGARAGQKPRVGPPFDQMPWRQPVNPDRPVDPLDAEGVQAIHATAMRILSEIGIEFLNPDAVAILVRAGCKVAGENVRMGEDFVMEMLGHAPASVVLTPRNPDHAVMIGSKHMAFVTVSSPPISWDMERGKQSGEFATFKEFIKLTQYFNCIHIAGGYPVEPIDIPPSVRHLDCLNAMLTLTDKVVHAYSLGAARVEDVMEMTRLAGGLSQAEFDAKPRMYTNINSVSPLKHDCLMLDGAMRLARRGQPVIVTPFMLAGATAPVTLAGAVALGIAEAVSAIALLQYITPAVPQR
jgi:trimethylamine--corrinoid protein Co-methyltransferase